MFYTDTNRNIVPGAAWATLERLLQEQGSNASVAKAFEKPERSVGVPIREGQELLGCSHLAVWQRQGGICLPHHRGQLAASRQVASAPSFVAR